MTDDLMEKAKANIKDMREDGYSLTADLLEKLLKRVEDAEEKLDRFQRAADSADISQTELIEAMKAENSDLISQVQDKIGIVDWQNVEIDRLKAENALCNELLDERNKILEVCPCPKHGPCVPHVLETLSAQSKALEEARVALDLIIPLAKGYAHQNDVGSNKRYVDFAEEALRRLSYWLKAAKGDR